MKTMTCKQLGGACNVTFSGNTFEEISKQSKEHGMAMFKKGDQPHLQAMQEMKIKSQEPGAFENWYQSKKDLFDSLPHS